MTGEIAQVLQEKAGLSAEQSQEVAQIVLDLVKSKIPPEFAGFINPILGESAPGAATPGEATPAGDALGGLGGLIGAAEGIFGHKG
jgi:hypothetical protein